MKVWREIYLCKGDTVEFDLNFEEQSPTWYAEDVEFDNQFEIFHNEIGSSTAINFYSGNVSVGDYSATFEVWDNVPDEGESVEYQLLIHVISADDCAERYANCCGGVNMQWLNQVGGMQNYYFNGVRTFEVSQDEAKRYIDYNSIARYTDRGNVYNGEIVSTKAIPKAHADMLDSLRYAIQAWVNVDDVLYPIVIDNESYTKYKSKDKKYDVYVKFIYSEPIRIQTQ
jgi:hypothetical protein